MQPQKLCVLWEQVIILYTGIIYFVGSSYISNVKRLVILWYKIKAYSQKYKPFGNLLGISYYLVHRRYLFLLLCYLSCGNKVVFCGIQLFSLHACNLSSGNQLLSCGNQLLSCGNQFLSCGFKFLWEHVIILWEQVIDPVMILWEQILLGTS